MLSEPCSAARVLDIGVFHLVGLLKCISAVSPWGCVWGLSWALKRHPYAGAGMSEASTHSLLLWLRRPWPLGADESREPLYEDKEIWLNFEQLWLA